MAKKGPDDREQGERPDEQGTDQAACGLPHLGIDEQKGDGKKQQRQRPGQQADRAGDLIEEPPGRPDRDRYEPVAGDQVDDGESGDVDADHEGGSAPIPSKDQGKQRWRQDEDRQFDAAN